MTLGQCLDGNYTFKYTATSASGDRTSSLFINYIVESYNTTNLNVSGGFVPTQYGALQLANNLQYNMSLVNKLVYNRIVVRGWYIDQCFLHIRMNP